MALERKKFWYLRHGETDYNAAGLSQGALDIPLNAKGRAQAQAAAPLLAGQGIVRIVASPMQRAAETAEIVNQLLRLPLDYEPDLREVVFGGMEGKKLQPWYGEWLEERFTPEGAEGFGEVVDRAAKAMARVLALPGPVLVVAHGGIFRALIRLMALTQSDWHTPNGAPIFCEPAPEGWRLSLRS